jgi:hypothetical protein
MDRKNAKMPARDRRKEDKQEYGRRDSGSRPDRKAPGESDSRKSPSPPRPEDESRWEDDGGEAG